MFAGFSVKIFLSGTIIPFRCVSGKARTENTRKNVTMRAGKRKEERWFAYMESSTQSQRQDVFANRRLTEEYLAIVNRLGGDEAGRRQAFHYMSHSTAIVHHKVVSTDYVPKFYDGKTRERMAFISETAHRILTKVMAHYCADPSYRKLFDFDPRLEELILLPRGYDSWLPFARVDVFLNETTGDFDFCEFNGDGSSGMNENREIGNSLIDCPSMREFLANHRVRRDDLFDPWVEAFLRIYGTYRHRVANPRIAICDYLENGVVDEFYLYAQAFKRHGVECVVEDVRHLRFDGEVLRGADGKPIHALWRRCVTNDVLEFWDESQELISAVRAEKVALIGSFAGHLAHDKQLFEVLFREETKAILTPEENAFVSESVPRTFFLSSDAIDLQELKRNKDAWIIKPTDHYGADHVYAGCFVDQVRWEQLIDEFAEGKAGFPFIAQRYIRPYQTASLPLYQPEKGASVDEGQFSAEARQLNNLSGLYLFDGVFAGVFSRLGPLPTISKDMRGITAATYWVD